MILFPNAKINIGLNILSKRPDGFHEIDTLMYPIALNDIITINKSLLSTFGTIKFTTTGIKIDGNPDENIILKAYHLLHTDFKLPAVNIHLHKSIPFGAGLGGGSADCAFTLKGLNTMFNLKLNNSQLENYAAKLGSDCPFFIKNTPSFSRGRGEILTPYPFNLSKYKIAIIIPPTPISTKEAYSRVKPNTPTTELEQSLIQQNINNWKQTISNDFEESVFSQKPDIADIKTKLYEIGSVYASLSGSGSAVFGIFDKPIQLQDFFPNNYFTWVK